MTYPADVVMLLLAAAADGRGPYPAPDGNGLLVDVGEQSLPVPAGALDELEQRRWAWVGERGVRATRDGRVAVRRWFVSRRVRH